LDLEAEGREVLCDIADFFIDSNDIVFQRSEVFVDTSVRTSTIVNITGWGLDWS